MYEPLAVYIIGLEFKDSLRAVLDIMRLQHAKNKLGRVTQGD